MVGRGNKQDRQAIEVSRAWRKTRVFAPKIRGLDFCPRAVLSVLANGVDRSEIGIYRDVRKDGRGGDSQLLELEVQNAEGRQMGDLCLPEGERFFPDIFKIKFQTGSHVPNFPRDLLQKVAGRFEKVDKDWFLKTAINIRDTVVYLSPVEAKVGGRVLAFSLFYCEHEVDSLLSPGLYMAESEHGSYFEVDAFSPHDLVGFSRELKAIAATPAAERGRIYINPSDMNRLKTYYLVFKHEKSLAQMIQLALADQTSSPA
jgi:hypothetical protein